MALAADVAHSVFLLDKDRFVAPLKHMAHSTMPTIETLCIDTVELAHALRQVALGRLNDKVVMIAHQAIVLDGPIKPPRDPF